MHQYSEYAIKFVCTDSNQVEMQLFNEFQGSQNCDTYPVVSLLFSHGTRHEFTSGDIIPTGFEVRFRESTCTTTTISPTIVKKCRVCGKDKKGKLNCCGQGGSWKGKCGDPGDKKYTWLEGFEACKNVQPKASATPGACLRCAIRVCDVL